MLKGIDVSYAQGTINWEHIKPQIDFAILRCGYGDDSQSQDDEQWARNVSECERLGIPYGVYLYSYCNSEAHLQSEIAHTLRLINGHNPFCVYLDMEDNSIRGAGKAALTNFSLKWCQAITAAGYKAGIYASGSWFDSSIDIYAINEGGYSIWVAQYGPKPNWNGVNYDIWQYTSDNDGISGLGRLDVNYMYNDIRYNKPDGWTFEDNKWCYYLNGQKIRNEWAQDSVDWCYLGNDGYLLTNAWVMDSVDWCYVGEDGRILRNEWQADKDGMCYLGADGRLVRNDVVDGYQIDAEGHRVEKDVEPTKPTEPTEPDISEPKPETNEPKPSFIKLILDLIVNILKTIFGGNNG